MDADVGDFSDVTENEQSCGVISSSLPGWGM